MFLEIRKARVIYQPVVIMTRAHLSQLKIVHLLEVYTFKMSISRIRHVDSRGAAPPISVYEIMVSQHCSNNGFYVIRSIVMLLLSAMLL